MARTLTLLDAVNKSLKKARLIQGEQGELLSLTYAGYQPDIDIMVDSWNEVILYMFEIEGMYPPDIDTLGTITLATGQNIYALPADWEAHHNLDNFQELHDITNQHTIYPYPDGIEGWQRDTLMNYQDGAIIDGQPNFYVIDSTMAVANIVLDRAPEAEHNGWQYQFNYRKSFALTSATDVLPCSDEIANDLTLCSIEIWRRDTNSGFDEGRFAIAMARAARKFNRKIVRSSW